MEIRVLRYFLETARQQSMTRAAEQLHISQPTLSKQIKDLEQELGKKLFLPRQYKRYADRRGDFAAQKGRRHS